MNWRIPIAEPLLGEEERKAVSDCVVSGRISQGERVTEFEDKIAAYLGRKYAVGCHSGTCANEAMLAALLQPNANTMTWLGGSVYVAFPACSSVAVSNPALFLRAIPHFYDLDSKLCLDTEQMDSWQGDFDSIILMVHEYGSYPENWDWMLKFKKPLLEDACVALGSEYQGKKLGSFGVAASVSFYVNKLITTGEGGMVVTDNEQLAQYCREYVNHGRTRSQYHESWHYDHLGRNAKMTDLQASIGLAQFWKIQRFIDARKKIALELHSALKGDARYDSFKPSNDEVPWYFWIVNWNRSVNMHEASLRLQKEFQVETRPTMPVLPKLPLYNHRGAWPVAEASQNGFLVGCQPAILEHGNLEYLKEKLGEVLNVR